MIGKSDGFSRRVHAARTAVGLSDHAVVKRSGVTFDLDLSQGIEIAMYLGNMFERGTGNAIRNLVQPSWLVLDIGANIGAHTLPMARLVGPSGRVVSFEPTEYAYQKLKSNLALNPDIASRVTTYQCFLAAKDEAEVPDSIYSSWPLSVNDGLHAKHLGQAMSTNKARARSLDGVLAEIGNPTVQLVKLDIDGFETEVLRGATAMLRDSRPIFVMELSPYQLEECGSSIEELLACFAPYGYKFYHERTGHELPTSAQKIRQMIGDGASINAIARAT